MAALVADAAVSTDCQLTGLAPQLEGETIQVERDIAQPRHLSGRHRVKHRDVLRETNWQRRTGDAALGPLPSRCNEETTSTTPGPGRPSACVRNIEPNLPAPIKASADRAEAFSPRKREGLQIHPPSLPLCPSCWAYEGQCPATSSKPGCCRAGLLQSQLEDKPLKLGVSLHDDK